MIKFERHINIESAHCNLIDALSQHLSEEHLLSISQLKSAIQKGALWLTRGKHTRRIRKNKYALQQGDTLHLYYDQQVLAQEPNTAHMLLDRQSYSVWYKPYGMLCQGSKWSDHCTINRWVERHIAPLRPTFIVHRLDRAATGLIILAHSKKAARAFSQLFEHHQLEKHYQIIVKGQANYNHSNIEFLVEDKHAHSVFTTASVDEHADISLVDVDIKTGRKHQIRQHAALTGHPVIGDRLYNAEKMTRELDLQLCAVRLAFICPLSGENIEVALPADLRPNLARVADVMRQTHNT